MGTSITHHRRCDVITLSGRFDSSTAPELEGALRASLDSGVYRIVIDGQDVEFFGSAAIRALIMAHKECRRWNRGEVVLANVSDRMRQVLEMAGIMPLMKTFDDTVMAVGSF